MDSARISLMLVTADPEGGIYHYTVELARSLAARGVDLFIVTSQGHEYACSESRIRFAEVFRYRRHPFFDVPIIRRLGIRKAYNGIVYGLSLVSLARVARDQKPNIIHVQGLFGAVRGLLTMGVLRLFAAAPLVITVHNVASRYRFPGSSLVARATLGSATSIIVHSEFGRKRLARLARSRTSDMHVVTHGNYNVFANGSNRSRHDARAHFGVRHDASTVLFFGFIRPYKGLDVLLRAFADTAAEVQEAHLIIAGQPREDFSKYQELLDGLGLNDRVTCHLGYVPADHVADYFIAADVVVLPYTDDEAADQSGVAQLAYAFGKPLIVSEVGGLGEVVEPRRSGYLVPPRNVEALARTLTTALSDPDHLKILGARGRKLAESRHDWGEIARRHYQIYSSLV